MFTVEYVVVPVDLSASSRGTYALARAINNTPPQTHLVHAWGGWPSYLKNVLFPYAPLGEDVVEFEHEIALEAEAAIFEMFELPDELPEDLDDPAVIRGHARDVLPEHIQGIAAQLIVVGSHGESGLIPNSLGSVAERLVRTAKRPVLVARATSSKPSIRRITAALDLSRGCHIVLEHAIGLAMQTGAELETIFVLPDPAANDTTQVMSSIVQFTADKAKKQARGRIDAHFDSVVKNLDVPFGKKDETARLLKDRKLLVGDPAAQLVSHCAENNSDVLVIGSQDGTRKITQRIGDVAGRVLRTANTHVMVVPL